LGFPWFLNSIRLWVLRRYGLKIGKNVYVDPYATIDSTSPWLISIGDECTITRGVIILSHDASTKWYLGYTKFRKVSIGFRTFIGVNSVILPGVTIGKNVIIGVGSIVTHDIPDNSVAVGNPARVIQSTNDYLNKQNPNFEEANELSKKLRLIKKRII
jgi:maltose O-acetyltransferase